MDQKEPIEDVPSMQSILMILGPRGGDGLSLKQEHTMPTKTLNGSYHMVEIKSISEPTEGSSLTPRLDCPKSKDPQVEL